jgi:RNA polymerase sigma factor (sigma-70 family)
MESHMMRAPSDTFGAVPAMVDALPSGKPVPRHKDDRPLGGESSFDLLLRAQAGDEAALNELCGRHLPRLRKWAHGRLPASTRGSLDTHDLVQDTLMKVIQRLHAFEPRHEGAFQGYLRETLLNRIYDEIRRTDRRPSEPLDSSTPIPAADPSPFEIAVGLQAQERYEAALSRLKPEDRELIILRIEMCYAYPEIAEALGKPSVAAVHMAMSRALARLADEMCHERRR